MKCQEFRFLIMCHLLLDLMVPMVVSAEGGTGDRLPLPVKSSHGGRLIA